MATRTMSKAQHADLGIEIQGQLAALRLALHGLIAVTSVTDEAGSGLLGLVHGIEENIRRLLEEQERQC